MTRHELEPAAPEAGRRRNLPILATVALLGAVACTPAEEERRPVAPAPEAAAPAAGEAGGVEAERWLGGFTVGREVDPQGAISVDSLATEFSPGETIYVSMAIGDAPADAAVHVVFFDPQGGKVAEDEKKVPAEARFLYFDSGDTAHWLAGEYRVELSVDGEVVGEERVTLAALP
ncbi:MAG TPA: hypothetical protein VM599_06335 [Thermoanaerobaculia bacterium]|nr:hypothetical protein [Thermoanaerobaculia bacterium]